MTAKQIITDKEHERLLQEIFSSQPLHGATTLTIGDTPCAENFSGFGVAITGASCYLLSKMEQDKRTALLKQIYSKDGLGLSVGRLSIGASDYSAELYSYDDVPFDTELKHFSIAHDLAYVIPMIQEILKINPDLYLFASPWSPPGWMKTGGSLGGGYMRNEFVDCYAEYIIKYLKAYAEHSITVRAITPQNEPDTWQGGRMPACVWHPETEANFIRSLREKLRREDMNTEIWIFDHNFKNAAPRVLWALDNCAGLKESCNAVAFHYYSGCIEDTCCIRKAHPELKLHFTEGGPRLYDNYDTDWCKWGMMITKALTHGYSSFTGWNLILNELGGPNVGPFFCGGLVTEHSVTGEFNYSGQYKAFAHIAPYINKDSKIYPVTVNDAFGQSMAQYPKLQREVCGFLIENSGGKRTMILINPNTDKVQTQFFLNGTWWYAELMTDSISTLLF